MWRKSFGSFVALVLAACGGSDSDGDGQGGSGSGSASGGSTSSGATCWSVPINETNDGQSACGPQVCAAASYCFDTVGICDPGCEDALNCPPNQTCDLSNATVDAQGRSIGLCRPPNASEEVACSSTSTGSGGDCITRCLAKAASCDAPPSLATSKCDQLCAVATEEQISCLEQTSCADLGEAFESGSPVCGI